VSRRLPGWTQPPSRPHWIPLGEWRRAVTQLSPDELRDYLRRSWWRWVNVGRRERPDPGQGRLFNPDERTRQLERALAAAPTDVELQQRLIRARARAGDLPSEAVERLIPYRPVQPWQFNPISYVLLEAERIGRESEWREGKVEIEWVEPEQHHPEVYGASHQLPYWGASTGELLVSNEVNYFDPRQLTKFYVGSRDTNWEEVQRLSGLDHTDDHGEVGSPEYMHYVLSVLPPRWIPNLSLQEAWSASLQEGGGDTRYGAARPLVIDPESEDGIYSGRVQDYVGCCPDAYDPQRLLCAGERISRRIVPSTRLRYRHEREWYRTLQTSGPLLDVRLIKSVRIMQKRGRRWV
jgi:hypothetical protein